MRLSPCTEWDFWNSDNPGERVCSAGFASAEFPLGRNTPIDEIGEALIETGLALTGIRIEPSPEKSRETGRETLRL